jgi:hypothetical protein
VGEQFEPRITHKATKFAKHFRGLRSLTKYSRYVTITPNSVIIWKLLSRGVEGPALRNPGNRFGD